MSLTRESTDTHCDETREARLIQPELPYRQLRDTDEGLRVMMLPFRGIPIYAEWAKRPDKPQSGSSGAA